MSFENLGYFDIFSVFCKKYDCNSGKTHQNWGEFWTTFAKRGVIFLEQNFKRYNAKMFAEIQLKF